MFVIGLYLLLPLSLFLLALVARSRNERRTAALLFGAAASAVVAPALALWLFSEGAGHTVEHPLLGRYSWDEPPLVADPGRAWLIAFAASSPLILVPIARAVFLGRSRGSLRTEIELNR